MKRHTRGLSHERKILYVDHLIWTIAAAIPVLTSSGDCRIFSSAERKELPLSLGKFCCLISSPC